MQTHVIALAHEEGGVFGLSFPDFPGCITTASSLDDVIERGAQVLAFHLEGMVEDGENMPRLRSADEIRHSPALAEEVNDAIFVVIPIELPGKAMRINITMDERLLAMVDRAVKASGTTRSGFLSEAARARISRE